MATKTETQIHELKVEIATLKSHVETLRGEAKPIPEMTNQIAVLQTQVAELTKAKEAWGQRRWDVLKLILAAGGGAC